MAIGVRGKLLLAVSAVAAMTVVASIVGWSFYVRMERQLVALLDRDIPAISLALKLAEASSRYAAGAAGLSGVQNNAQRQNVDIALRQQALSIRELMDKLRRRGHDAAELSAAAALVGELERELIRLNLSIEKRIALERRRRALLGEVDAAGNELTAAYRRDQRAPDQRDADLGRRAAATVAVVARLYEIANADAPNRLAQRRADALTDLRALAAEGGGNVWAAEGGSHTWAAEGGGNPQDANHQAIVAAWGEELTGRLGDAQQETLQLRADIGETTRRAGDVAGRLSTTVAQFVDRVEARSDQVRAEAAEEVTAARWSLAAVAVLTFVGPVAFVWVLIGRRIVGPLTALAASARAVAGGDMTAAIPRLGHDEMGQMADALTAFRDAAAQLAERTAALQASEARLRSILDASVYPIMILHAGAARVLFCNELAAVLFKTEMSGGEAYFPDPEAWPAILEELWPKRRVANLELSMRRPADGETFWALVSAVTMTYQDEPAVLVSFNDITERKLTERQLRQARDEAETALESLRLAQQHLVQSEKMASLGQLVAGVAHEINTPLGIALTSASYLSDETRKLTQAAADNRMRRADFERYMANAQETTQLLLMNVTRAADLVHSFKQVSADQTSDSRRTFNLKDYLDDVLLSLKPSWKKAGHAVSATCPDDLEVDGYPGALSQILANLLVNALIHAYDDGQSGRIAVTARPLDGDLVEMIFADDGKGIAPAKHAKVFDPFFTTRRGAGSTGLGLNIVYNLVTSNLGGSVRLDSVEGGGARFVMVFPRVAPAGQPES